ncbi:unnamed protein product [Protopolystoma xenopodis]|uniref:Uncharacterized protein n=1 Tax=Protopolystoma xenopodis TaxID=117903 RepID=A0A3S5B572_9PLAT|nr:unnamed protein product [Protopolystoma xenopodis]
MFAEVAAPRLRAVRGGGSIDCRKSTNQMGRSLETAEQTKGGQSVGPSVSWCVVVSVAAASGTTGAQSPGQLRGRFVSPRPLRSSIAFDGELSVHRVLRPPVPNRAGVGASFDSPSRTRSLALRVQPVLSARQSLRPTWQPVLLFSLLPFRVKVLHEETLMSCRLALMEQSLVPALLSVDENAPVEPIDNWSRGICRHLLVQSTRHFHTKWDYSQQL